MTLADAWTVVLVALGLLLGALRQGRRRKWGSISRPQWREVPGTVYDKFGNCEGR